MFNLLYGVRNGKLISIDEISSEERGLKCNCFCPSCGSRLLARIGTGKRTPHFAHVNKNCDIQTACQTVLHMMAKEVISETKQLVLPAFTVKLEDTDFYKSYYKNKAKPKFKDKEFVYSASKKVWFDSVLLERKVSDIIPDIIAVSGESFYLVEIAVTHFIDDEKRRKIERLDLPVIEIDLSGVDLQTINKTQLEYILSNESNLKKWVHYPMNYHERREFRNWGEEVACDFCNQKKEEEYLRYKANEMNSMEWSKLAEQFSVSDSFKNSVLAEILKKEENARRKEENARRKTEYENKMYEMYQPQQYKNIVEKLRSDVKFERHYSRLSIAKSGKTYFYIDIPITGEFIFKCDRRIWQSEIFDRFIFNGVPLYDENGRYPLYFDLCSEINKWIKEKRIINWEYAKKHWYNGRNRVLINDVVEKYIEYLCFLGFLKRSDRTYESYNKHRYSLIAPKTLKAPNRRNAEKLYMAINEVDNYSPDVDILIRKFLESNY